MNRWVARVSGTLDETIHYDGAPPGLFEGVGRIPMPATGWVVLEVSKDGVFLIRYSDSGEFAGDTWSPTRDVALEVAAVEFGLAEDDWIAVPEGETDPIACARRAPHIRPQ